MSDVYQEVMPLDRLTEKQERFVQEYMVDFNRVRAFNAAGFKAPDDRKAALRVAQMLKNPLIRSAIEEKQREYALSCRRYSPIDVMLANLDYWFTKAQQHVEPVVDNETGEVTDDGSKEAETARKMAQDVARDAAPYVHPRLQAIAVAQVGRKSINEYTDAELAAIAYATEEPADDGGAAGPRGTEDQREGTLDPDGVHPLHQPVVQGGGSSREDSGEA